MADAPTDTPAGPTSEAGGSGPGGSAEDRRFRLGRDVLTVDSPTDLPRTRRPAAAEPFGEDGEGESSGVDGDIMGPSLRIFTAEEPTRRPAWRQRLIDAERGFSHSFRSESTLTAYCCAFGAALLMAGVLRISAMEGAVLLIAFSQAMFVEFGRIAVREMTTADSKPHRVMATASVMAVACGLCVAALTLGRRLIEAWG